MLILSNFRDWFDSSNRSKALSIGSLLYIFHVLVFLEISLEISRTLGYFI